MAASTLAAKGSNNSLGSGCVALKPQLTPSPKVPSINPNPRRKNSASMAMAMMMQTNSIDTPTLICKSCLFKHPCTMKIHFPITIPAIQPYQIRSSSLSRRLILPAVSGIWDALTGGSNSPRDAVLAIRLGMQLFRQAYVAGSLVEFDRAIELDCRQQAYLWQRGLSLYYLDRFQEGAEQFRLDVANNPNDTEESIWCFLCEARLYGVDEARKLFLEESFSDINAFHLIFLIILYRITKFDFELKADFLSVGTDPRPVMRQVYNMFKDGGDPEKLVETFSSGQEGERFYSSLYAGLYYEALGKPDDARKHLEAAVSCPYGQRSNDYMASLAKVHLLCRNWGTDISYNPAVLLSFYTPLTVFGVSSMGFPDEALEELNEMDKQRLEVRLHSFSDLSHVSPVVFLYLLKECYLCGASKATKKFRALQQQIHLVLRNSPQPGPASFAVYCLYLLPIFESHSDGFSHMIISALHRFLKASTPSMDSLVAKDLAARLFLDVVHGDVNHDEKILVKILGVFDVKLENIANVMSNLDERSSLSQAKAYVESIILELIESKSYITAVSLLEQFSIHQSGEAFLHKMIDNKEFIAAEKWSAFMGRPMLCLLVKEYVDLNMLKSAFGIIKRNDLQTEFPDVCQKYRESSLKNLAEKGCWDIAEERTKHDRQLLEYLVYLAMEAGYSEKVDELCDRYSLQGFVKAKELEVGPWRSHFLNLHELLVGDIIWVDEVNGLQSAISYIEGCKVVGLDCEWKPNYIKGSKPNKVSIMQIASENMAFIFDLMTLYNGIPEILDSCLIRMLHSPRILKLGYNFQCDIHQLAQSYSDLKCFKHYEMLLDVQNVFKEPRGGLSGLAKKILGAGLNKTRRNSDWEQRPLTENQLEYAALDAVVLIHIFRHIRDNVEPVDGQDATAKAGWKSYIVPHNGGMNKSKKEPKVKKKFRVKAKE
ncbi:LOW QUALITY PROTEIN: hypothetical protein V2J09_001637 [Rumex salicifolius]